MKLPRSLRKNCCTATRTRGGGRIATPPHPHATAALAASPAPRHSSSYSSPLRYCHRAEPQRSTTWPMINAARCGAKSSPSEGAVVPVRGHACWRHPGPGGPPCSGIARGAAPGSGVGGRGGGAVFCGMATAAIMPGRIRQHHRRPDAGSHGPGPAPVGGVAWQMPAPCGRDKGCCCQPAAAGSSLRSWPGGASC
jgi:hypothetical protein